MRGGAGERYRPDAPGNANHREAGFTLVETLLALALMAIVIPVTVEGLRIATKAGEVSQRKALAARLGEQLLNNTILNGQTKSAQNGTQQIGGYEFRYTIRDEPWTVLANAQVLNSPNGVNQGVVSQTTIHQISADVTFTAQNQDYTVHLSTLYNTSPNQ